MGQPVPLIPWYAKCTSLLIDLRVLFYCYNVALAFFFPPDKPLYWLYMVIGRKEAGRRLECMVVYCREEEECMVGAQSAHSSLDPYF